MHWRDLSKKDAVVDLSPLAKSLQHTDQKAELASISLAQIAAWVSDLEDSLKQHDEKMGAINVAMSEVMKKSLFDQEAVRKLFDGKLGDLGATLSTKLAAFEQRALEQFDGVHGDLDMLHKLENWLVDDIERVEKDFAVKLTALPAPLPSEKQNYWPSILAILLSLLAISLIFLKPHP